MSHPRRTTWSSWLRPFVVPYRWPLAGVLLLSLLATGIGLLQPLITQRLIDEGLVARDLGAVGVLCALMLGAVLLATLLGGVNRLCYVRLSGRILFGMREAVFAHLQRLPPRWFTRTASGDTLTRLDGDVAEIQRFAVDSLLAAVGALLVLGGALAIMLSLSWQLTLIALLLLPAHAAYLLWMRPRVEAATRATRERNSAVATFLYDALGGMKLTQALAAEARDAERMRGLNRAYLTDQLRLERTAYLTSAVPTLLSHTATAAVFFAGALLLVRGELSLGVLIAFTIYMARAAAPVQTLLGLIVAVRRVRVSLERVAALLDESPAVTDPPRPRALPTAWSIELRAVSFSHDGQPLLADLSLMLPAGAKVGICGASGAGKSTLADLLQRHYDPQAGAILVGGVDLRELPLAALRRRVGVVSQDLLLLRGSIADNLRYAVPGASDAMLWAALDTARLGDEVRAMPEGLETRVGSEGTRLSGGQRQRLAIARTLLLRPRVLIVDEATSGLEKGAEAAVLAEIDRLFGDCTRLFISHSPQVLGRVERLFELRDGRLLPLAPARDEAAA